MQRERGFTLTEVIIAIVVLTVGLLGLVTTAALVTRMIARGARSATAATYAAQRIERMRIGGCTNQAGGTEDFYRGSRKVASNTWWYANLGSSTWRMVVVTRYMTAQNRWRSDTVESVLSCVL